MKGSQISALRSSGWKADNDTAAEIAHLAGEIAALDGRLDELAGVGELTDKLTAASGQAEFAQAGLQELSRRVDDLAGLEHRLDELAARLQTEEVIEELRGALAGLATQTANDDRGERGAEIASLVARLDELAAHIVEVAEREIPDVLPRLDELSARIEDVAAAIPVVETDVLAARVESLAQAVFARVEEVAATVPREDELAEIRARLDELAALSSQEPDLAPVAELRARVDDLVAAVEREPNSAPFDELRARLDELSAAVDRDSDSAAVDELRLRVNLLAATVERGPDTSALDEIRARLEALTTAVERGEELREEVRRAGESSLAERESLAQAVFARVEEVAATVPREDELAEIRARLDELAALSSQEPDLAPVAELRARVDDLVAAVEREPNSAPFDELRARLDELSAAVDRDSDSAAVDELRLRVNLLAATVERGPDTSALDEIRARLEALTTAVERGEELREEVRRAGESSLAERESLAQAVFARVEEVAATVPREDELAEIRARLDELAARPTSDGALQERVDELAAQLEGLDTLRVNQWLATGSRLAGLEAAIGAVVPLEMRIDAAFDAQSVETAGLREQVKEMQESGANQAALEARLESVFAERFDVLANRITDEMAAVRAEKVSLEEQIGELRLRHRDAREAKTAAERLVVRVDELVGLRAGDAEAAQVAAADLAMRMEALAVSLHAEVAEARGAVDGLAEQSVAAVAKVERALRKDLRGIAERLEEGDAGKLEALEASVAKLKRRLEKQAALGDEQVRVTERALRKGLASLGERLAGTESAYVDAGKAMRRSIERLGAAVVEADARMAHQIPVSEAEGCVAFAPTAVGYRLIELPGAPPEVGSTIELDTIDGALVVTGYGRSPLPLDSRACAYLDRA